MKILLVEDNPELTQNVVNYLSAEGIICESATTLFEAQDKILSFGYDCILLDLMLPDGNGLDLIEIIKSQKIKTTVLIISAKDALDDKLKGLDQGADDYLPKPFHLSELLARLKAIFRRSKLGGFDEVVFNEITIEIHQLLAKVNDQVLELTKKEFDLLLFFITNKNRVLGKQQSLSTSGETIRMIWQILTLSTSMSKTCERKSQGPEEKITSVRSMVSATSLTRWHPKMGSI